MFDKVKSDIAEYGFSVVMIPASDYFPSFAYSIGLFESYKHPEVICFGLSEDSGHGVINVIGEMIKEGTRFESNKNYKGIYKNDKAIFLDVEKDNIPDYFGFGMRYYDEVEFPAMEAVWTDREGNFPWETGYSEDLIFMQPLLDRNSGFKFYEAKNLGVFTSKQWIEENKPILEVIHDEEGDWQFLTGGETDDDIRLVALEQLVLKDKTLNQVFDLDYGESARRESVNDEWERD